MTYHQRSQSAFAILTCSAALLLGSLGVSGPLAAKSDHGGKNQRGDQQDDRQDEKRGHRDGNDKSRHGNDDQRRFNDNHKTLVRDYYVTQNRSGRCPPGLAKKNNGCMPPGQAKKWDIGRPLPREVIYYNVPQQLVIQIGQPPSGYRYVRVASDILMIAIGSGMVVDAIRDLGRI